MLKNMKKIMLYLVILLYTITVIRGESKLVTMVVENLMECMAQASGNFSMETCQEMLGKGNDNSLEKYKECKCLASCTAKKLGVIDEHDNGVPKKLIDYATQIESDPWRKEANKIVEKCKDISGKGCELAFNFITCALGNSSKAYEFIKTFLGELTKTEDEKKAK